MFKKIFTIFAVCSLFFMSMSSFATESSAKYQENVNYYVRGDKLTPHKEIREFFSFWCGHCFSLQETFETIAKHFPQAKFERNPVHMLGGQMGVENQKGLIIAKNYGLEDVYVKELFQRMHVDNAIPLNHEDMTNFMASIGIPKNKFEQESNSFVVLGQVAQLDKWVESAQLEAVPEILVNGKYLVIMESVKDEAELLDLIEYLLNLDNLPDYKIR